MEKSPSNTSALRRYLHDPFHSKVSAALTIATFALGGAGATVLFYELAQPDASSETTTPQTLHTESKTISIDTVSRHPTVTLP